MASRSLEKGESALGEVKKSHPQASISLVQLDVTSDESIAAAVEHVTAAYGKVDTLINNAGICPLKFSRELLRETFETNATSPGLVTQAFLPLLTKSLSARVVYVTSALGSIGDKINGKSAKADYKVYRMSKAALNMLAVCDASEYGPQGIKVFNYCPGLVLSDLAGMRQAKLDMGVPPPDKSAKGLLAIHQGKQDENVSKFLHAASVVDGAPFHPW